ncbi:MAG: hypothetical protein IPO92_09215 [Saprospiraceae bacterium]|nr:hypothetical protein [Saprospiraceae bacterium]
MTYKNGDSYFGNWVNGRPSGYGKYTFQMAIIMKEGFGWRIQWCRPHYENGRVLL